MVITPQLGGGNNSETYWVGGGPPPPSRERIPSSTGGLMNSAALPSLRRNERKASWTKRILFWTNPRSISLLRVGLPGFGLIWKTTEWKPSYVSTTQI